MEKSFFYCLFCETSREPEAEALLKKLGCTVISVLVERNIYKNGKFAKESRPIIPGYVFIEAENEPDWKEICKLKYVYKPLRYSGNRKKLRGNDFEFVKWLKGHNGKIKTSKAAKIGTKIKIIEGPLKELEGRIVKINKRQKCAGVKIEGDGIKNIIWLSYELFE